MEATKDPGEGDAVSLRSLQQQLQELQQLMEQRFTELPAQVFDLVCQEAPKSAGLHGQAAQVSGSPRRSMRPSSMGRSSMLSTPTATSMSHTRGSQVTIGSRVSFQSRTSSHRSDRNTAMSQHSAMSALSETASSLVQMMKYATSRSGSLIWDATKSQRQVARLKAKNVKAQRKSQLDDIQEKATYCHIRNAVGKVVDSSFVTVGVMVLVFVHVILLGIEVDLSARSLQEVPEWFSLANLILVSIFVLELLLRVIHLGCQGFCCGVDCAWNIFDAFIVALSVADVMVDYWSKSLANSVAFEEFRVWRTLRFFRVVRGIRIVRIFRYIAALRTLVISIAATMSSLFWTLFLLVVIFYAFAVSLTNIVTEHCRFLDRCNEDLHFWRSIPQSMLTLFMTISQGIDWQNCLRPLFEVSGFAVFLMLLYVVIAIFAILNVVTGVFCNTAIESASYDKDIATMKQEYSKTQQAAQLKAIFQEMDREDIKCVSLRDLEAAMEAPELQHFLESMGISTDDIWTLFTLLDMREEGLIDLDAFVSGCMQMYGTAKSMQMAKLSYENMLLRQVVSDLREDVFQEFSALKENLFGMNFLTVPIEPMNLEPVIEKPREQL